MKTLLAKPDVGLAIKLTTLAIQLLQRQLTVLYNGIVSFLKQNNRKYFARPLITLIISHFVRVCSEDWLQFSTSLYGLINTELAANLLFI